MMRICYLVEWNAYQQDGVLRKILAQFQAWRSAGADGALVFVSPSDNGGEVFGESAAPQHIYRFDYLDRGGWRSKISKSRALARAARFIKEGSFDVIYYRQSSWTPGIERALRSAPRRVFEVNSLPGREAAMRSVLHRVLYLITRSRVYPLADGFVAVSRQVAADLTQYDKPVVAIGNGFDLAAAAVSKPPRNERPQLVFVGTPDCPWHGIDRLLKIAALLPQYDFHVVGPPASASPSNVIWHGRLDWRQLAEVYKNADVGISSLALDRIGVSEISPLKAREYVAYGLPVVGAYSDTDLDGAEFYLRLLPEGEDFRGVSDAIAQFVDSWRGRRVPRADARRLIGAETKEAQRIAFISQVAGQSRCGSAVVP